MSDENLRMDAYYYSFNETGQTEVDLILSAVACAGKSFHHTDQWNDEDSPWPGHTGNSPIEWICNAAFSAAQEMARLKAEVEALRKDAARLDRLEMECEAYGTDVHEGNRWVIDGPFATLRDAIDAGMDKECGHD